MIALSWANRGNIDFQIGLKCPSPYLIKALLKAQRTQELSSFCPGCPSCGQHITISNYEGKYFPIYLLMMREMREMKSPKRLCLACLIIKNRHVNGNQSGDGLPSPPSPACCHLEWKSRYNHTCTPAPFSTYTRFYLFLLKHDLIQQKLSYRIDSNIWWVLWWFVTQSRWS